MRSHNSLGGSVDKIRNPSTCFGVMLCKGPKGISDGMVFFSAKASVKTGSFSKSAPRVDWASSWLTCGVAQPVSIEIPKNTMTPPRCNLNL